MRTILPFILWGLSTIFLATGFTSLLTGNWFWIDAVNKFLPSYLHFSKPTDSNFWMHVYQRPWSDPMPVMIFIGLGLLLVGFVVFGLTMDDKMTTKLKQAITEAHTKNTSPAASRPLH